jgi:methylmalonyl-CoA mutase
VFLSGRTKPWSLKDSRVEKYGREDIMVVVGGVLIPQDYQSLFDAGAVAVLVLEQNQRCCYKILEILIGD